MYGQGGGQAIAEAIKANGVLVHVTPENFERIFKRCTDPVVVHTESTMFRGSHKYLISYKGLAFYTKSKTALYFGSGAEIIEAKSISMPG